MDFRTLHLGDLPELVELQKKVYDNLEDKEVLQTLTEKEFKRIIAQGFIIGVYEDGRLIGSRSMYVPSVEEDEHLADDVGIENKESVIYSEISFIDPAKRGRGMQSEMGRELIEMARKDGRFENILTTVMPANIPSLKDKFRLGFKIRKTTYKYNGKKRHIMHLSLTSPFEPEGEPEKVHFRDTDWMMVHGDTFVGNNFDGEFIYYYRK
ncbi:GNAT family N-acetyltransferase [Salinicoccus hispanicus]|uniref:GNAT family N-acetyltransferase n=1 Tax=Salinicoccus hispanicus TaxID=157225 RepID=A0A6N8TYB8_9STAP|nr:GNAT family protein [Salinicoccus hispanicus]MXQ50482.1 GNAT family N-acetyltransferase [Salinicoccus hispanicus]